MNELRLLPWALSTISTDSVRLPIAVAMAIVGVGGTVRRGGRALATLKQGPFERAKLHTLSPSILPADGLLASRAGLSQNRSMPPTSGSAIGGRSGDGDCGRVGFAAICGSSVPWVPRCVPLPCPMRRYRYADSLSTGRRAGAPGHLIPPSVIFVLGL
jgi:hypothetical protein